MDFCIDMNGHSQLTVVLLPCSLQKQGINGATMGITSCILSLFVCLILASQSIARGDSDAKVDPIQAD